MAEMVIDGPAKATNGTPATKMTAKMDAASAKVDAATALLDRKLKLVERLSCAELFAQLDRFDESLTGYLAQKATLEQMLKVQQAKLAEDEALVTLGIEGKNETERKALKATALRNDPACQATSKEIRAIESDVANCDHEIDVNKRRIKRLEQRITYQTSILQFLGG